MSHIALLLPDLEVGGAQRVMLLLAKEFAARDYEVDVVVLSALGPLCNSIPSGVRLVDLGARSYGLGLSGFTISSTLCLAAWIKRSDPDVLLSSINGANLVALLVRKLYRISTRVVIREAASVAAMVKGLRFHAMRWLYSKSDCVIALSSVMAKELVDTVGIPKEKIKCIPNPVDAEFILEQAKEKLEHPWVAGQQYKLIVSVGRLIPEKDLATLVKAFSLLPKNLDARLLIIGEGPERGNLEHLVKELEVSDGVQLIGFDANPWRWMKRSHLFVLSSCSEGCPNSLLEAITLGLPVVVTEYDYSVRELAGRYHFDVVSVGDEEMLAKKIEEQLLVVEHGQVSIYAEKEEIIGAYLDALEAC